MIAKVAVVTYLKQELCEVWRGSLHFLSSLTPAFNVPRVLAQKVFRGLADAVAELAGQEFLDGSIRWDPLPVPGQVSRCKVSHQHCWPLPVLPWNALSKPGLHADSPCFLDHRAGGPTRCMRRRLHAELALAGLPIMQSAATVHDAVMST